MFGQSLRSPRSASITFTSRPSSAVGLALALALGLGLAACGDDDTAPTIEALPACNPLGGAGCVTPWPSALYEVEDPSTATGMRVDLLADALPVNTSHVPIDPSPLNQRDGFSPATQIFTVFADGVDPANLVGWDHIEQSITDASPTVIVDMERGERVAHFAEIDANAFERYDQQAIYIRPAARLRGGTRYAVAIRRSLKGRGGIELPIPEGFTSILSGEPSSHARLERVRPRYQAIFDALQAAGIPRDDLVVAWDFTTGSDDQLNADMLGARDAALTAMGERAANMRYTVTTDEPVDDGLQIKRRVKGTFQAPLLLTDLQRGGMRRDPSGSPVAEGTADFPFVAMVPACATPEHKAGILVFGHGFFGDIGEAQGSYMRRVAEELCLVVVGTEWVGMRTDDVAAALDALADLNLGMAFGERIIQGMIDTMTLTQLARGAMASDLLVENGASIVDPEKIYFFGISQGAILGSTFFAFDPTLTRGAFNVGGANWSILFERSNHWNQFALPIKGNYPGPLNLVIIQALLQFGMDLTDPVNVAQRTLGDDRYPGTPPKQFLLQIAAGDCQVSNLGGFLQTRTLGMPLLTPSVTSSYGIDEAAGPLPSALVVYDEHPMPPPEVSNLVNSVDNGTHNSMRSRNAVVRQLGHFFETGEVINTCGDGTVPCDCATGACD